MLYKLALKSCTNDFCVKWCHYRSKSIMIWVCCEVVQHEHKNSSERSSLYKRSTVPKEAISERPLLADLDRAKVFGWGSSFMSESRVVVAFRVPHSSLVSRFFSSLPSPILSLTLTFPFRLVIPEIDRLDLRRVHTRRMKNCLLSTLHWRYCFVSFLRTEVTHDRRPRWSTFFERWRGPICLLVRWPFEILSEWLDCLRWSFFFLNIDISKFDRYFVFFPNYSSI